MKDRNHYLKIIRGLIWFSMIQLIVCVVASFLVGDMAGTGFFLVLGSLIVFIVLTAIQYKLMHICRCRKCGHVEIFEMKKMVPVKVMRRCPKCNAKIKADEVVG